MKKVLYLISLDNDMGELWLDENKKPLSWVHVNDAQWRDEYHNFIIDYLGGVIVDLYPRLSENDVDKLYEEGDSLESIWKIMKRYIK